MAEKETTAAQSPVSLDDLRLNIARATKHLHAEWERASEFLADNDVDSREWGYFDGLAEARHILALHGLRADTE
jgi:hypothetical protein